MQQERQILFVDGRRDGDPVVQPAYHVLVAHVGGVEPPYQTGVPESLRRHVVDAPFPQDRVVHRFEYHSAFREPRPPEPARVQVVDLQQMSLQDKQSTGGHPPQLTTCRRFK
jgi:hypothetical protein